MSVPLEDVLAEVESLSPDQLVTAAAVHCSCGDGSFWRWLDTEEAPDPLTAYRHHADDCGFPRVLEQLAEVTAFFRMPPAV